MNIGCLRGKHITGMTISYELGQHIAEYYHFFRDHFRDRRHQFEPGWLTYDQVITDQIVDQIITDQIVEDANARYA